MTRVSSLQSDISSTILDQLVPNSSLARKHLMLIKKNVQGFSLIELMVAVGIMGGMTTLAVPQYGKYKIKAAQTEVKTTLANVHGAQELHLVDKNFYAKDLAGVGLGSLPTNKSAADALGQNFMYGASTAGGLEFCTSSDGTKCDPAKADGVEYLLVATAVRKLASCARASALETWCLDDKKLITNSKQAAAGSHFSSGTSVKKCNDDKYTVNTSLSDDNGDASTKTLC